MGRLTSIDERTRFVAAGKSGSTIELPDLHTDDETKLGEGWVVTVYDNEVNTYEEVMLVLTLSTGCDGEEAYIEAWEIDHYGKCVVHRASEDECKKTADVIGKIGIRVEATPND